MYITILIRFEVCCFCCSQRLNPRMIMWVVDFSLSSSSLKELIYFRTTTVKSPSSGSRPVPCVFITERCLENKFWTVKKKERLGWGSLWTLGEWLFSFISAMCSRDCGSFLPNWRLFFIVNILKIHFLFINWALPKSENYKSALKKKKKQHNFHILSSTNWFSGFFEDLLEMPFNDCSQ